MSEYGPTHNAEASKPLADWRDSELERLRRELAEARGLLQRASDEAWEVTGGHPLLSEIDAFLASHHQADHEPDDGRDDREL